MEIDSAPFWVRVDATKGEYLSALRSQIRTYVDHEEEMGNELDWRHFVERYSEWNHEHLYETVVEEIMIYVREKVDGLSSASQTLQGA
ncbi:hypothetical protein L3i20_v212820 [Paenibacillus sp. L3-i20]|nr:hypothetical protein L3i20_v212820 [Paenibacillus sp. L3-i20]